MATTKLRIQNAAGDDKVWRPDVFHRVHPDQAGTDKHWWFQAVEGIFVMSENAVRRTRGKPATCTRIREQFGELILDAARTFGSVLWEAPPDVECDLDDDCTCDWHIARETEFEILLTALIAVESRGKNNADRFEPHINEWSFGLTQCLTSTAFALAKKRPDLFPDVPSKPVSKGGVKEHWEAFLEVPRNAIYLAAMYVAEQNKRFGLKGDPILVYASYNAGSPRPTSVGTPWGVVAYDVDRLGPKPGALDNFASWYGDACAVISAAA